MTEIEIITRGIIVGVGLFLIFISALKTGWKSAFVTGTIGMMISILIVKCIPYL